MLITQQGRPHIATGRVRPGDASGSVKGTGGRGGSRRKSQNDNTRVLISPRCRRDLQRATHFRHQAETKRVIELIDAEGNKEFVRQQGQLGVTRHSRVLGALEQRALRYRRKGQAQVDKDKVLYREAIDETGTVPLEGLLDTPEDSKNKGTTITQAIAAAL